MKKHLIYWLAAVLIVAVGCQKELSFEGSNTPARGSLRADVTGDCLPKTVNGTYVVGVGLVPATNTITVQVNITKTGTYVITTDTINGIYFRGTGSFTTLGANNVILRGNGTPFSAVNSPYNYVVNFDTTFCDIQVPVLPAGSGPAVFTLVSGGTPSNCASAVVTGTYSKDNPLNGTTNYVDIMVNVGTIGTYTITATGGGMTFQKTGTFTVIGNQTVRLPATGTPTILGANTVTFATPFASCSFTVTVIASAAYTIDCPNVVVNGTYQAGTPLGASNFITIPITVTSAGPYGISVSINGMTFAASGTLALTSTSITLTGSGTPITATGSPFNLSVGTPACLIPITVTAAPVINWSFKIGTTTYQGSSSTIPLEVGYDVTTFPPFSFFNYVGYNPALDELDFDFIDLTGGILANETYNTNALVTNTADFYFFDVAGTLDLQADPGQTAPPANITFKITSHNTSTKTIIGTFTGTAYDNISATVKTITNGTFTIVYP